MPTKRTIKSASAAHCAEPTMRSKSGLAKRRSATAKGTNAIQAGPTKNTARSDCKKQPTASERIDAVMQTKAGCRKELVRLYTLVAKLTAAADDQASRKRYFNENWLATRWGTSVKHIRNLRYSGTGPIVTYFGRSVRYRLKDVIAFEKCHAFSSSAAKEQAQNVARQTG